MVFGCPGATAELVLHSKLPDDVGVLGWDRCWEPIGCIIGPFMSGGLLEGGVDEISEGWLMLGED